MSLPLSGVQILDLSQMLAGVSAISTIVLMSIYKPAPMLMFLPVFGFFANGLFSDEILAGGV